MEFLSGGWAEGEIEVHAGRCGCGYGGGGSGCGGGRRVVGLDLGLRDRACLIITLYHSEIELGACVFLFHQYDALI